MSSKLFCLNSLVLVLFLAGFAQAELLVNPGFEDGLDGWSPWGGGSGTGFWDSSYHADVKEDGTAHSGDKYVAAGLPNNHASWWWGAMWVKQERAATEGKTYQISAWVRDGDAAGAASLIAEGVEISWEWRDAAPEGDARGEKLPDGVINHAYDLTGEWTHISSTEVAPAGTLGLTVSFMTAPGINIDIDDASFTKLNTLSGLADVTVADGAIVSIRHAGAEHVVANKDLVVGITTRWFIDPATGLETLWAEGDSAPGATVSGTGPIHADRVGSNADNYLFVSNDGGANMSSINSIDFQETIFEEPTDTFFVFERGGDDKGFVQAILEDGSLGQPMSFNKAPYANTGAHAAGLLGFGMVFETSELVMGVRITASGHDTLSISTPIAPGFRTETVEDLEAASAAAVAGDTIFLTAGTYAITSPIEIKDGVIYQGKRWGQTIIDGGNLTRAFVAWGDPGATNGMVDADGVGIPNETGPVGWALDRLTIQNCVADANNPSDILSAARNLLSNYEPNVPYTLETAQAQASATTAEWFTILSADNVADPVAILVPDGGFDDQVLGAGGYTYIGDGDWPGELDYPGPWQSAGGDAWIDNHYYRGDDDLLAVSGDNKVYGNDGVEDAVYQILDDTFVEGATYTLSMWTGSAWADYDDAWSLSFIGEDTNSIAEATGNGPVGSWEQVSVVYTATAADAGNKIGIKFAGDHWVTFDEVTLSVVDPASAVEVATAEELQAYLDNNLPGSEGHLVNNEGMNTGGGALILRNGAAGTVTNCSFLNNQAPLNSGDGGAINTSGSGSALTIDNSKFNGNSCADGGGAIRVGGGSVCTITGTSFTENQAIVDSGDGGAIMTSNTGTNLTVDNCEFTGNACIDGGGAIRLGGAEGTKTITGSTFTGNHIVGDGGDGGAIKVDGDNSTYVLTDCAFIGNYTNDDGAAMDYKPDRSELTVTNCSFIGNGKDPDGNVTTDDGVFKLGDDDAGPVTLENCLFADNEIRDDRFMELKAAFSLLNCTFINNVAGDKPLIAVRGRDWGSVNDDDADVTTDESIIDNCLFINNTLLSDTKVIGDTRNDVFAPTVTNCLFFGNLDQDGELAVNTDDNSVEVGTIDASAVTDATELVVDPAGDYHLVLGSLAIDASDPNTATGADIEGTEAVGVRDVGAYEFVE